MKINIVKKNIDKVFYNIQVIYYSKKYYESDIY